MVVVVVVAGALVAVRAWRRRQRRRQPGVDPLCVEPAAGARGPVCVIGDSLTYAGRAALVGDLVAAGFGPVRVDARPARRCVRDAPLSGVRAAALARRCVPASTRWLVALGQNDADRATPVAAARCVTRVLDAIGPAAAVTWLDLVTVPPATSPAVFDAAIATVCAASPCLRVAPWSATAAGSSEWFTADGIHNTAAGVAARNGFIVEHLAAGA